MSKNKVKDLFDEIGKKTGISEVIINALDNVYVEKDGELIRIDIKFTHEEVDEYCQELAKHNRKFSMQKILLWMVIYRMVVELICFIKTILAAHMPSPFVVT